MTRKLFLVLAGLLLLAPTAAPAQSRDAAAIGPRAGFTIDPDQFTFGGQFETSPFVPALSFVPSVEVGVGDDWTVVALNADFHYHFAISGSIWGPYVGGGLGVNVMHFDYETPWFRVEGDDTEVGANLILGVTVPTRTGSRFFTEARFGLGDIPETKLMAGWNFRL